MKTTPFMTLLFALFVLLNGIMSFQVKKEFFPYFLEIFAGLSLLIVFYFLLKEKRVFYWVGCFISAACIINYGVGFYFSSGFFHAILTAFGAYIFILYILTINKVAGSQE